MTKRAIVGTIGRVAAAAALSALAACGAGDAPPATAAARESSQSLLGLLPGTPDAPIATTSANATLPLDCAPKQVVSPGGRSSCNLVWLGRISLPGQIIGGKVVGDRFYLTHWETGFHAFDVADPENPKALGSALLDLGGYTTVQSAVENEDPATNGKLAILSRTGWNDAAVIDTRDPAAMKVIARVPGATAHTHTCLLDCTWSYGSTTGVIVDLRDPLNPVLLPTKWTDLVGVADVHDVTEIKPGMVITSSDPAVVLDTTDPADPKVLFKLPVSPAQPGLGQPGPAQAGRVGHNVAWPRAGEDRFFLGLSEGPYPGLCELYPKEGRSLYLYDTRGWKQKKTFALLSQYTLVTGNGDTGASGGLAMVDSNGNPSALELGVQGCSVHWFDTHASFADGGLLAMAAFSHGMRLLNVAADGRIQQLGYFVPHGAAGIAATVDVRWASDRVLYVMDVVSGTIDVLKYTGPLPRRGPLASGS
jgi:hypothetical protein